MTSELTPGCGRSSQKARKRREFLALRVAGADREPARGKAVDLALGDGAEIARAEKDADLVEVVRPVDRRVHAEAGEAEIVADAQRRGPRSRTCRGCTARAWPARLSPRTCRPPRGRGSRAAKNSTWKGRFCPRHERLVLAEADAAILVVGDAVERPRQLGVGRLVGLLREGLREAAHGRAVERAGCGAEGRIGGDRRGGPGKAAQKAEQGAALHQVSSMQEYPLQVRSAR